MKKKLIYRMFPRFEKWKIARDLRLEKERKNYNIVAVLEEILERWGWGCARTSKDLDYILTDITSLVHKRADANFLEHSSIEALEKFMTRYYEKAIESLQNSHSYSYNSSNQRFRCGVFKSLALLDSQNWKPKDKIHCLLSSIWKHEWEKIYTYKNEAVEFILCEHRMGCCVRRNFELTEPHKDCLNKKDWDALKKITLEMTHEEAAKQRELLYSLLYDHFQSQYPDIIVKLQSLKYLNSDAGIEKVKAWHPCSLKEVIYFLSYFDKPWKNEYLYATRHKKRDLKKLKLPKITFESDPQLSSLGITKIKVYFGYEDAYDGAYAFSTGKEGFLYVARYNENKFTIAYVGEVRPRNYEGLVHISYP